MNPCHDLAGGGWTRVRHVKPGKKWHPATDQLVGTDVYGTAGSDESSWSINFESAVPGYDEFLFAYGGCDHWLAATKQAVTGGFYAGTDRDILQSSASANPYKAKWYRRSGNSADPSEISAH
eukprot:g29.t1